MALTGLICSDQILFQGRLEKNKVEEMLEGLLPGETVDTVSNLIFSTFDKENRGSLSFVEFVSSIHCMSNSSPEVSSVTPNCQALVLIPSPQILKSHQPSPSLSSISGGGLGILGQILIKPLLLLFKYIHPAKVKVESKTLKLTIFMGYFMAGFKMGL